MFMTKPVFTWEQRRRPRKKHYPRVLNVQYAKNQSEAVTMSLTMRCPDAKAMEFGGVETGSINA